jgi:proteasome lid subunit RPN8/RPN11
MFDISPACREAMFEDAVNRAPGESCGLIIDGAYVACVNQAEDAATSFEIAPEIVAQACASGRLGAVIHSHPEGLDCPSRTDMEQQEAAEVPWGIVVLSQVYGPSCFFWGDQLPIAPYEGRVFRHGTADCYALVRDWYRKERQIVLPITPRDPDWWDLGQNVISENILAGSFPGFDALEANENLEYGDVLLFQVGAKVINHTGIYMGNGLVLHHLTRRLSRIDVLGPWKQKFHLKTMRYAGSSQSIGSGDA